MTDKTKLPDLWLPRWGSENPFFENSMLAREKVTFRDGSKLIVFEENEYSANYIKELEWDAEHNPHPDLKHNFFRMSIYSKLVACSVGDVPTDIQARSMPSSELKKWYDAAKKINPNWFVSMEKSLTELASKMTDEEKKRKPRKRQKSGNG